MKYLLSILFLFFNTISFAADITVEMLNKRSDGQIMVYSEDISRINVGDTITWTPTTKGHNVEFLAGPDGWEIPKKSKMNKEYSYKFDIPGIYLYQCTPHGNMGMLGLIVVGNDFHNLEDIKEIELSRVAKSVLQRLIRIAQLKS